MRAIDAIDKVKGENHDQDVGIAIARRAMEEPLRQIAANAGDEPWVVVAKVLEGKGNFGYNAATGEYGDMIAWVYSTQPKSLAIRCTMQHLLVSASVRADVD